MDGLWNDIEHVVRHLAAGPGFTAAAVLTIALRVGGTSGLTGILMRGSICRRPLVSLVHHL
jgi:hypothetical protein